MELSWQWSLFGSGTAFGVDYWMDYWIVCCAGESLDWLPALSASCLRKGISKSVGQLVFGDFRKLARDMPKLKTHTI